VKRAAVPAAASALTFVGLFLFVYPRSCLDIGGVPSWQRCSTVVGSPALSMTDLGWDASLDPVVLILIPALVGLLVWLGRSG
jgi:hypothetical protein